ncbi:MAG: hypothetical protein WCE82_11235 [Halobacteriota archaeon]
MRDPAREGERLNYWLGRYTDLMRSESYKVEKEVMESIDGVASLLNQQVNADTLDHAASTIDRALGDAAGAISRAEKRLTEYDRECGKVEEEIRRLAGESRREFVDSLVKQRTDKINAIFRSLKNVTVEIERLEKQLQEWEVGQKATSNDACS